MSRALAVLILSLVGCAKSAISSPPQADLADVAKVVEGNSAFALDLYGQLAKDNSDNLFFSPYSISTALAMTYAGARGQTAEEMAKTLHFPFEQARLHPAFAGLTQTISGKPRSFEVSIANRLWGQTGYPF